MIDHVMSAIIFPITVIALASVVFTITDTQPQIKCNTHQKWYKNPDLKLDMFYLMINAILRKYMMICIAIILWSMLLPIADIDSIKDYVQNTKGPLGSYSFSSQVIIYLICSDFSMYWLHRAFHCKRLWFYHAVHHSEQQVDWTTAYRFHPINIAFSPVLTDVVMLTLGISPEVMFFLRPFDAFYSLFVHANLNWTFGKLKYVIATPVFHRWHHASNTEAMSKNFAPTLAIWDVIFGTFYMPEKQRPAAYGINEKEYPTGFIQQLLHPFRAKK